MPFILRAHLLESGRFRWYNKRVRRRNFLVADDEESEIALLRLSIERTKLPVDLIFAHDGVEVVNYLASDSGIVRPAPDLLLLDLKMPRMTGLEVLEWLRTQRKYQELPVVVYSNSGHDSDVGKALAMGAREYFVKPNGIRQIMEVFAGIYSRYASAVPAQD